MLTADYLSWFLEGKIYAFGAGEFSNVIDLDKSIAAYTNAAKHVSPDAEKSEEAKRLTAEIRFYLGLAQCAKSNAGTFSPQCFPLWNGANITAASK
ncbi:MAG: hypothetical protein LBK83_11375 [Treponema sp.]|jgi:hypothetical protein|nr:hypothetical protein [Treponema sp.]